MSSIPYVSRSKSFLDIATKKDVSLIKEVLKRRWLDYRAMPNIACFSTRYEILK